MRETSGFHTRLQKKIISFNHIKNDVIREIIFLRGFRNYLRVKNNSKQHYFFA